MSAFPVLGAVENELFLVIAMPRWTIMKNERTKNFSVSVNKIRNGWYEPWLSVNNKIRITTFRIRSLRISPDENRFWKFVTKDPPSVSFQINSTATFRRGP